MPQIEGKDIPAFAAWLESKGISVIPGVVAVGSLQATQGEINPEKVANLRGKNIQGPPILTSRDGYVLDGHHRWAALLEESPFKQIRTLRVGLPIRVLVEVAHKFPKSFKKDLQDRAASHEDLTASVVAWRYICQ